MECDIEFESYSKDVSTQMCICFLKPIDEIMIYVTLVLCNTLWDTCMHFSFRWFNVYVQRTLSLDMHSIRTIDLFRCK